MDTKSSAAKALEFLNKHSKKILIGSIILSVVAIAAAGGVWWFQKAANPELLAVIGNDTVTKTEYTREFSQCTAGVSYDKKPSTTLGDNETSNASESELAACKKTALDNLIYLKALRQDATKYGISVIDQVELEYKQLGGSYSSEQVFLATYKDQFNESPSDIKRNLEVRALEGALSEKLLNKTVALKAFVRYDNFEADFGAETSKNEAMDLARKYLEEPMKVGASEEDLQKAVDKLKTENPKYKSDNNTFAGLTKLTELNESTVDEFFNQGNRTDWNEIVKLKNDGDTTAVFISPGGDAAIWRLVGRNGGSYSSWDDYQKQMISKAKVFSVSYNANLFVTKVAQMLNPGKAIAACSAHMVSFIVNHTFYIGTTTPVSDINIEYDVSTVNVANGCKLYCSTASCSGNFDDSNGIFTIGDGSTKLNCNARWNITIRSNNGTFFPLKYVDRSFKDNGTNLHLDYHLADVDAYARSYYDKDDYYVINSNTHELGDDDGTIVVRPNAAPIPSHISPVDGAAIGCAGPACTAPVNFTGMAKDSNSGDQTKLHMYYVKVDPSTNANLSVPVYVPAADYIPLGTQGVSRLLNTDNSSASIQLPIGKYRWRVYARDEHGLGNPIGGVDNSMGGFAGDWYFTVYDNSTLGGALTATPSSGTAPLNGVVLSTTVTGTAIGTANYQFKCKDTDSLSAPQLSSTYTCNYAAGGVYTPQVKVTKGASTFTAVASVTVNQTANFGCNVTPADGLAPLVVKVVVTNPVGIANMSAFTYDLGDAVNSQFAGRGTTLYYTYASAGQYTIRVSNGALQRTCTVGATADTVVDVSEKTGQTGGEVSP